MSKATSSRPACHALYCYARPEMVMIMQELRPDANTALRLPRRTGERARLTFFCKSSGEAQTLAQDLRAALRKVPPDRFLLRRAVIKPANWRENWKRHFPAHRVSPRLVVKPPWRKFKLRPGDRVVEIDPGVSFGTGLHPTTRACLRLLDEYTGTPAAPLSFLDIGCGSGILAIAAARLGCRPLLALDHDPQAVDAARRNCTVNDLSGKITFRRADILDLRLPRTYDLVAANLLAGLLLTAAPRLIAAVAPRGRLILSGILRRQYAAVRHGYRQLGFHEISRMDEGEWITGGFARR